MEPTFGTTQPFPLVAPREPKRFSHFAALILSFFSAELYRDVAKRWRGFGFWYLVLLLFIAWVPLAIQVQVRFDHFMHNEASTALNNST